MGGATGQIGAFGRVNWAWVLSDVMIMYPNGIRNRISRIVVNEVTRMDGRALA